MKNWFEVSTDGFAELLAGREKSFIVRELIQNVWDENSNICDVSLSFQKGEVHLIVSDDAPNGFRDIKDVYQLYGKTLKRQDPCKRGRFNLGNKEAVALCRKAIIETTTGTIVFDERGRTAHSKKTDTGSKISLVFSASQHEYDEILSVVYTFIPPEHITYKVNSIVIPTPTPLTIISNVRLTTEFEIEGVFRRTIRKTSLGVFNITPAYLYEMGLPVCKIDCEYSINVGQKIPLGTDRSSVSQAYLQDIYAEVLKVTATKLNEESVSSAWVHTATEDPRIDRGALKTILDKRFGERVVVATPTDPKSIDEALAHGYRVIRGAELSAATWENVREFDLLPSSKDLFGTTYGRKDTPVELTTGMLKVETLVKKIALRILNLSVTVSFVNMPAGSPQAAEYGNGHLTFNVQNLGTRWFDDPLSTEVLDLIIHELGHSAGKHMEVAYHEALTKIGSSLTSIALHDPAFFNV
jgi:hypothetical protein